MIFIDVSSCRVMLHTSIGVSCCVNPGTGQPQHNPFGLLLFPFLRLLLFLLLLPLLLILLLLFISLLLLLLHLLFLRLSV